MKLRIPAEVKYILDILKGRGFEAYIVGGCVRDAVLARTPNDWDITTSARPEDVKAAFRRTVDTGIAHGTVTVLVHDESFEVTTYRIDGAYEDGRHPSSVTFTPNLTDDLMRRDFTVNAMAYNEKDGLVDPYGGMDDLQRKCIRCVGDPDERFSEDALRVLRAVRFSAQLGFSIENETLKALSRHAENLRKISAERIQTELVKLLVSPHPGMIRTLYETGITRVILPEFDAMMETPQNTPYHMYNVGEHTIKTMEAIEPDRLLRLTMLLHDIGKPAVRYTDSTGRDHFNGHGKVGAGMAHGIMRRLKFDNDTIAKVDRLILYHDLRPFPKPKEVRRTVFLVGEELFISYLKVQWADTCGKSSFRQEETFERIRAVTEVYEQILADGDCLTLKDLAVNGYDLMEMGIHGREIGEILNAALKAVIDEPEKNEKDTLLRFAARHHRINGGKN